MHINKVQIKFLTTTCIQNSKVIEDHVNLTLQQTNEKKTTRRSNEEQQEEHLKVHTKQLRGSELNALKFTIGSIPPRFALMFSFCCIPDWFKPGLIIWPSPSSQLGVHSCPRFCCSSCWVKFSWFSLCTSVANSPFGAAKTKHLCQRNVFCSKKKKKRRQSRRILNCINDSQFCEQSSYELPLAYLWSLICINIVT